MRHLIWLLLALPLATDAQIYIDSYRFGCTLPLLDCYPGAAAAYSLRLLDNDYAGNCIQVRRSNDNTTSNIGFSGGYLDTAALKTFCGANNCFVRTWYDQSGLANNAVSTVDTMQPAILASGTIIRHNGIVALDFNNDSLRLPPSIFQNIPALYIASAIHADVRNPDRHILYVSTDVNANTTRLSFLASRGASFQFSTAGRRLNADAFQFLDADTISTAVVSGLWDYANAELYAYKNGTQYQRAGGFQTAGNLENTTPLSAIIGRYGSALTATTQPFDGKLYELIIYQTSQLSNRAAIETNINTFYQIY